MNFDFNTELNKLLASHSATEAEPLGADALSDVLAGLGKKIAKTQTDLSMQVEEIYDLVSESQNTNKALRESAAHEKRLATALLGLCDIIEDFCTFADHDEALSKQANLMRKNADKRLAECSMTPIGEVGEPFDPTLHTVLSTENSPLPREHIAHVLNSGYRYMGKVLRKASVVLSK